MPDRDLEPSLAVDLGRDPARAVHGHLPAAQEVPWRESLVHSVETAGSPLRVAAAEILEQHLKQRLAIPLPAGQAPQRAGVRRQLDSRLIHVHADSEHDGVVACLGQAPSDLLAPQHDELDRQAECRLERVRDGDACDERELRRAPFGRRLQEEREQECCAGGSVPGSTEPSSSGRLVIGDDERALGQRGVDEQLRRLARPDVEAWLTERHGFSHTEMCFSLSLVNGRRCQSAHRSRSRIPASCAMRSSSEGHT